MGDSLVLWYDMDVFFPFFGGLGRGGNAIIRRVSRRGEAASGS